MSDTTKTLQESNPPEPGQAVRGLAVIFSETVTPLPPAQPITLPVIAGREIDSSFSIPDPNISREHARFEPHPGGVLVQDLGSRNGTRIQGIRIGDAPVPAPFGTWIRLGKTILQVVPDASEFRELPHRYGAMVGGPSLLRLQTQVRECAHSRNAILIQGENGVGKELIAHAIHEASDREGPIVPVNCAAIPDNLIESELFGHSKGAFSGAENQRQGLVRAAHQGTLFLDELGELPLSVQAKLLRVLDGGEVRPVGSDTSVQVDVRIVAATNRDVPAMVGAEAFREDLYHRIAADRLTVPALRDRPEDIAFLAKHFASEGVVLSADFVEALRSHSWPGNIRELRNVVRSAEARARIRHETGLRWRHLPSDFVLRELPTGLVSDPDLRAQIELSLRLHKGNVSKVARALGVRRPALYEDMRRLGIEPEEYR